MKKSQPFDAARLAQVATIGQSPPADWRWVWRLSRILLITGAILAAFFAARHWVPPLVAEHWRRSLRTAGDERAEVLVASAARLGRPGIPVLLDAMGSARERVSQAGVEWLERELRSWENLPNREGQRNVEALAEALAAQVGSFPPAARLDAARLALRILRWRLDPQIVNRGRVTCACDQVLRAADLALPAETAVASRPAGAAAEEGWDAAPGADQPPASDSEVHLRFPELLRESPARPRIAARADQSISAAGAPSTASDRPEAVAQAWSMRSGVIDEGLSDRAGLAANGPTPPAADAAEDPGSAGQAANLGVDECFRRVHSARASEAREAEAELKRRGIDDRQMSIGRRLFDPDPLVRLALVRQLPEIPGIDASGWLLKMAADESGEVRLAAITLLATSNDPQILAEVEETARNDHDERVRRQAEVLARQRGYRRR